MKYYIGTWIPGYEGYYSITLDGEVYSYYRRNPKLLKVHYDPLIGYKFVVLRRPGEQKKYTSLRIHRALALTYFGECPEGHCVSHRDGNKLNNNIINLEYVAYKENTRLAAEAGAHNRAGKKKIPYRTKQRIILLRYRGMSVSAIHKETGVHPRSIQRIWKEHYYRGPEGTGTTNH